MKTLTLTFAKTLTMAALAVTCLLALPQVSHAKNKDKHKDKGKHDKHHRDDDDRAVFGSRPRSGSRLSIGNGYAGRGYYYGPAQSSYFHRQPGVTYYRTREDFYGNPGHRGGSVDYAVQKALARRGYYRGPIDGDIGPGSSNAIARYQEDRGLRVTGSINSSLLHSLDLS